MIATTAEAYCADGQDRISNMPDGGALAVEAEGAQVILADLLSIARLSAAGT